MVKKNTKVVQSVHQTKSDLFMAVYFGHLSPETQEQMLGVLKNANPKAVDAFISEFDRAYDDKKIDGNPRDRKYVALDKQIDFGEAVVRALAGSRDLETKVVKRRAGPHDVPAPENFDKSVADFFALAAKDPNGEMRKSYFVAAESASHYTHDDARIGHRGHVLAAMGDGAKKYEAFETRFAAFVSRNGLTTVADGEEGIKPGIVDYQIITGTVDSKTPKLDTLAKAADAAGLDKEQFMLANEALRQAHSNNQKDKNFGTDKITHVTGSFDWTKTEFGDVGINNKIVKDWIKQASTKKDKNDIYELVAKMGGINEAPDKKTGRYSEDVKKDLLPEYREAMEKLEKVKAIREGYNVDDKGIIDWSKKGKADRHLKSKAATTAIEGAAKDDIIRAAAAAKSAMVAAAVAGGPKEKVDAAALAKYMANPNTKSEVTGSKGIGQLAGKILDGTAKTKNADGTYSPINDEKALNNTEAGQKIKQAAGTKAAVEPSQPVKYRSKAAPGPPPNP